MTTIRMPGQMEYELYVQSIAPWIPPAQFPPHWLNLDETVQLQWAEAEKIALDPNCNQVERAWAVYAASANDPMMPDWSSLPPLERAKFRYMWQVVSGFVPPTQGTKAELMDQLQRIRQYSKCFTNAYDRKQAVFVLVEQDATAWVCIAQWIKGNIERLTDKHPKIIAAKSIMARFMESAKSKLPD